MDARCACERISLSAVAYSEQKMSELSYTSSRKVFISFILVWVTILASLFTLIFTFTPWPREPPCFRVNVRIAAIHFPPTARLCVGRVLRPKGRMTRHNHYDMSWGQVIVVEQGVVRDRVASIHYHQCQRSVVGYPWGILSKLVLLGIRNALTERLGVCAATFIPSMM